jgi:hypothetical protein
MAMGSVDPKVVVRLRGLVERRGREARDRAPAGSAATQHLRAAAETPPILAYGR